MTDQTPLTQVAETKVATPPQPQDPGAVPSKTSDSFLKARAILRGQAATPAEMLQIAKGLKQEMRFGLARRLLTRASNHENIESDKALKETIVQQLALCSYKDEELPLDDRLDRALKRLEKVADFKTTTNQETLGLLGSIHKRKFEVDTQRKNLERSLHYYMRGYKLGPQGDQGYTGINAAFVLDFLASLEEEELEENQASPTAENRRKEAQDIRRDIAEKVGGLIVDPQHEWVADQWWYYATMAEAHFGLKNYDKAVEWITNGRAAAKKVYEWELESCARQLATIARLQLGRDLKNTALEMTSAWNALEKAFGTDAVPRTAFAGKIGLALSGGGFRASLYHLGVLAKLAELDVLRNVEVLSCVSGGSIVGAHYYLKVRHLLQTRTESEIDRQTYISLVSETIDEFVEGVKKNIRTRVAVNPLKNFRMFWSEEYSRTTRAAELFEKHLFSRVKDGKDSQERYLNDLTIAPLKAGQPDKEFSPKYQNWRRTAKVPILVLNAATLNTGHTWQYTASWMGESPAGIDTEVDGNDRLRRMYYSEAPEGHKQVRLGRAVGASAAVPGVFEPLTLNDLYPHRIVRLVDGGVTDNQGVATLLEQDCRVMLVSDASGQMESQPAVGRGILGVLLRTNNMFQARIRTAEYHDLKGRRRSNLLRGFMFVHLKGDLEVDPVDWVKCLDRYNASDDSRPPSRRGPLTSYGIAKDIQQMLSALRTDLDSFSEAEAYALMTSGYRMTEQQFKSGKCVEGFSEPEQKPVWKFLEIESCMTGEGKGYEYLKKLLSAGSSLAFKVWQIDPILKYLARGVLALLAVGILFAGYKWWTTPLPTAISQSGTTALNQLSTGLTELTIQRVVTWIGYVAGVAVFFYLLTKVLTALLGTFVAQNAVMLVRWKDFLKRVAVASFVSSIGFVLALVHLSIFDRRFLSLGSLDRVKQKSR